MPWFKVDDTLAFHHKTIAAGNPAMGLWVRAGSWSMQQLTDGFVPDQTVKNLGTVRQAKALVRAGLWMREAGGYRFNGHWCGVVGTYRRKISTALRDAVYCRDGYACLSCGATDDLSLDHVHPYSRGGKDTLDNLQTLCRSCNSKKGARI